MHKYMLENLKCDNNKQVQTIKRRRDNLSDVEKKKLELLGKLYAKLVKLDENCDRAQSQLMKIA